MQVWKFCTSVLKAPVALNQFSPFSCSKNRKCLLQAALKTTEEDDEKVTGRVAAADILYLAGFLSEPDDIFTVEEEQRTGLKALLG